MSENTFLVEIGTEELPPKALRSLAESFAANVTAELDNAGLAHGKVEWFAAPRRLALKVANLAAAQADREVEKRGPAIAQAFDAEGKPSKAAEGWARGCGPTLTALAAHRLQRADSAFVTGPARFDTLTDPHLFLGQLAVKFRILQFFDPQGFFFIEEILIVISRIGHQLATIEVDNARRHIADKGTVMRNKDNRAFKGFQETFQPVDGFDIEVVSGLIQQQHARPTDQGAAQRRFT